MSPRHTATSLAAGIIVFAITVAGWLYASLHSIDTGPLFYIAVPVITALFVAAPVSKAADAAQQAATQTNGGLDARIKAGAAAALADRDKARTRQAQGDISETKPADPTGPGSPYTYP